METVVKAFGNIKAPNEELLEKFKVQLESGCTVVHACSEPKEGKNGDLFFQLYVVQRQVTVNENLNKLDEISLGWSKERISFVRSIRNIDVKQVAKPDVASWLGEGNLMKVDGQFVHIQKEHTLTPQWAGQEPIKTPNSDKTMNIMCFVDGDVATDKPVYLKTTPVLGEPKHKYFTLHALPESNFVGIEDVMGEEVGSMEN